MHLYLVQHGASKSEAEDPQRSLTDEGRRTVEHMAEWLASLGVALDRIEHSDKLRARQTAEILAARLQPQDGTKQVSAGLRPRFWMLHAGLGRGALRCSRVRGDL